MREIGEGPEFMPALAPQIHQQQGILAGAGDGVEVVAGAVLAGLAPDVALGLDVGGDARPAVAVSVI